MSNKNNELLYLTIWSFDNEESNGVCKKINAQFKAFKQKGFNAHLSFIKNGKFTIVDQNNEIIFEKETKNRFSTLPIANDYLKNNHYKYVYIRYCLVDKLFINICKTLHDNGTKTIVELPTYPYDMEFGNTFYERVSKIIDKHYREKLHLYIDRIATLTDDKTIFNCPTIKFRNGLDVEKYKVYQQVNDDCIDLVGIAMFTNSHGYERIIEGLYNYYEDHNNNGLTVNLHLIGDGEPKELYMKLISNYNLEKYVKLYGVLQGEQIEKVFSIADVAINAIGMHNVKVKVVQTIKSNEYALRGLPMISELPSDLYAGVKQYEFIMPYDDSPLDVNQMIKWYSSFSKQQGVREEIRSKTEDKVNVVNCLDSVFKYFKD